MPYKRAFRARAECLDFPSHARSTLIESIIELLNADARQVPLDERFTPSFRTIVIPAAIDHQLRWAGRSTRRRQSWGECLSTARSRSLMTPSP